MSFYLILYTLFSDSVLTASLPRHTESISDLAAKPISPSNLLSPANIPASSSNLSSSENLLKIGCDARKFGKNLKVQSCRNVFNFVLKDEKQLRFAQRDSGLPADVSLPLRTLSSDGLCFVQPILKEGVTLGHASPTEIGQAAYTMLQTCVVERGMGGMASNIGGDNKVNVAISDYKPNIKCDTTSNAELAWDSCVLIFINMRATKQPRIFGSPEDPLVEEQLPLVLESSDGGCQLGIDIEGSATVTSWYEIWEAVVAIASMCTRQKNRGGKAKGLGLAKNLRLEMSEKKPYPYQKGGNTSIVILGDAGTSMALQDLTGMLKDNGSLLTMPIGSWTSNISGIAASA